MRSVTPVALAFVAALVAGALSSGAASASTRVEKTFGKWAVTCVDDDSGNRGDQTQRSGFGRNRAGDQCQGAEIRP